MRIFNTRISVSMDSGAEVTLTPRQKTKVENYVNDLLTSGSEKSTAGGTEETVRTYKTKKKLMFGARRWTAEEGEKVKQMLLSLNGKLASKAKLFKQVAQAFGRTPQAILMYYYHNLSTQFSILTLKSQATAAARPEEIKE